jgi:hypothetical protein
MRLARIILLTLLCGACGSQQTSPAAETPQAATTAVATTGSASARAPKGRFAPRDECSQLPGAADFHARLVEVVQLRDSDALAALADPAIKLDFGGGGGVEQLRQKLGSGDELWKSLEQLLKLGCARGQGGIVMPWLFAQELGDIDPTAAMLVMGEDVPILSEPRASAKPLGTISWDLVNAAGFEPDKPFQRIAMPGKQDGYIATDKLRSVLDYRLLASNRSGQWRIEALVAGD